MGLRNALLDPVVNSIFVKMRDETRVNKEKLEQSRQDLDAWKFTPDRWLMAAVMTEDGRRSGYSVSATRESG
jgi:hypothetical protein